MESRLQWCKKFVEKNRLFDNRKVLLVYDGYRSHMSFKALKILSDGNAEVFALPSHTSGITQPLDVSVISAFKQHINEQLYTSSSTLTGAQKERTILNLCFIFWCAYDMAFTRKNIRNGFEKPGYWPYCPEKLLFRPQPRDSNDLQTILSVDRMSNMPQEKVVSRRSQGTSVTSVNIRKGFVDTTYGCLFRKKWNTTFLDCETSRTMFAKKNEAESGSYRAGSSCSV